MDLKMQDFGVCERCRGMVQLLIEEGIIQDVLHTTPEGEECGATVTGADGSEIFYDGICCACCRPGTYQYRAGDPPMRKKVGHIHPDLDRRLKEREAAGGALEDIYPGVIFPAADRPDLLDQYFDANHDKED